MSVNSKRQAMAALYNVSLFINKTLNAYGPKHIPKSSTTTHVYKVSEGGPGEMTVVTKEESRRSKELRESYRRRLIEFKLLDIDLYILELKIHTLSLIMANQIIHAEDSKKNG